HRQRYFYGSSYTLKQNITMSDLHVRTDQVIRTEIDVIGSQMNRNGVRVYQGEASFVDPHKLLVVRSDSREEINAKYVLIAVGSKPYRPANVPFAPGRVMDSDQ